MEMPLEPLLEKAWLMHLHMKTCSMMFGIIIHAWETVHSLSDPQNSFILKIKKNNKNLYILIQK